MVEPKATEVCLLAQQAYPETRRASLLTRPPIGYLLRIERETDEKVFRCIYSIHDGHKIHTGPCRFESWTDTGPDGAEPAPPAPADAEPETL